MSTKAEQPSSKVSLVFGAKSKAGFVIPKNKLSGSLVPVFKAGQKNESKEESGLGGRKTKWNSDFTLDPWVRKTRALAYQTRLDQINKLLKTKTKLGEDIIAEYDGSISPTKASTDDDKMMHKESQEQLELERREIIGEILNLNPSFKPPADYKPLLKEAKVTIPIKAYPGHNFIHLLLGAESNIQKRLQEDFGAKIGVHGIKKHTGEKCEITQASVSEGQSAYEELYIDIFTETYDKLDAAVSLVELLLNQATSASTPPPAQFPSATPPTDFANPNFPTPQPPSYSVPSNWAPPNPNPPPVHSSPVPPLNPKPYQYNPYTAQSHQSFGPPPQRQISNSRSFHRQSGGPGPQRPSSYHEAPQMQGGLGPQRPTFHEPSQMQGPQRPTYHEAPQIQGGPGPQRPPYHEPPQMQGGPGPQRPPYHEAPQMQGPPPLLYNMPAQPMRGPPIYQATQMATQASATLNPAPMRPPMQTYQPNGLQSPSFRPGAQNQLNQFNYRMDPPSHLGFQYPRAQTGPYGYSSGPGQIWNSNASRPNNGGMGRNFRAPLGPGGNNNINISNNGNGNQYYDPFLPTSGPVRPRREAKVEADPEYEDLMASVGVK